LEADPACGLSYTRSERRFETTGERRRYPAGELFCDFDRLLFDNTVENCTAVARRELILRYYAEVRPEEHPEWLTDDAPMWIWFAACSRIRASEEVTAVHRMLPESVSQSRAYRARIAFCDSLCDISLWFDARYGAGRHLRALRRRRMRVALWVLSRDGTTAEYLSRWWRDVRRTPLLVFDAAGYGLLVKKWLRRQPKR
jgi:glycosyltransferases involved in cell wall biogenesis